MKLLSYFRIIFIFTVIFIIYLYWTTKPSQFFNNVANSTGSDRNLDKLSISQPLRNKNIVLAVVACGDRIKETLNMIKSAIMFTRTHLTFVVVCEEKLTLDFKEKLAEWQIISNNAFNYKILPLTFPKDNSNEWRRLFKPCAAQRLFLPSLLPDIDSLLYVDTDTLFLTALETIWDHFNRMNSSQMAALAPEHEDPNVGWYNRFARHPYYGQLGTFRRESAWILQQSLATIANTTITKQIEQFSFKYNSYNSIETCVNSGVMLMNLTKMREFKWTDYVVPIYKKYKLKITWGDQDIINIIFHFHPDKLYIYPCRYNFRPDHCMYMSVCKSAEAEGVTVLHGSRGFFHSEKQPVFQVIYRAFEEYQLGNDLNRDFYMPLESYLETTADSNCGHVRYIFLKHVKKFIDFHK